MRLPLDPLGWTEIQYTSGGAAGLFQGQLDLESTNLVYFNPSIDSKI